MSIPVHVIAGFLGSGKTTLMNRVLGGLEDRRAAIIVNDFGEVPLDGDLIDRGEYALKELPSGCVCCTLKVPLEQALAVFAEEEAPDVILVETTGVAVPAEVAGGVQSSALKPLVHVGNVVCVVDAGSFLRYEPHFAVLGMQVQQANTLILNKVDLVSAGALGAIRDRVEYLRQPGSVVAESEHCAVERALVFQERPVFFPVLYRYEPDGHAFQSFSVETEAMIDPGKLDAFLNSLGPEIPRAKGIVRTGEGNKLVQVTLSGVEVRDWHGKTGTSRFVCVGKGLEPEVLKARFEATFVT